MKRLSAWLCALFVCACYGGTDNEGDVDENPCTIAVAKLETSCGLWVDHDPMVVRQCQGADICTAACVNRASCTDIDSYNTEFTACLSSCEESRAKPLRPLGWSCEIAAAKLEGECGIAPLDSPSACTASDSCSASCVTAADCVQIHDAMAGESNAFSECMASC